MQALHLLALIPVAETTADGHSYGFRPARSTADANAQVSLAVISPPPKGRRCIVAAASDRAVTSPARAARLLRTEPQVLMLSFDFIILNISLIGLWGTHGGVP